MLQTTETTPSDCERPLVPPAAPPDPSPLSAVAGHEGPVAGPGLQELLASVAASAGRAADAVLSSAGGGDRLRVGPEVGDVGVGVLERVDQQVEQTRLAAGPLQPHLNTR